MATKAQKESFLNMIIPIAQRQAKKHSNKIYASVCIAQAAHESGWGTSKKMINANAVYGIKVGNSAWHFGNAWHDKAYKTGTTEYYDGVNPTKIVDWFRAYSSIEDATEDYFDMLTTCKRYRPACNESSPKRCIEAIVRGGYATGPEYAKHIMDIINQNTLTRYDRDNIEYFPKYRDNGLSIVVALESIGVDSSYNYREKIYAVNYSDKYKGSEKQNLAMLAKLSKGQLIKP